MTESALDAAPRAWAFSLNIVWLSGGVLVYARLPKAARNRGALTQIGK